MLRQFLSAIQNDDNPRLHRVPFLLWWMMSYALGWYAIYVYEEFNPSSPQGPWFEQRLCAFLTWLRLSEPFGRREGLLVGFIFGLVLSLIQTWLIRERYGYIPRFWGIATIVGATIAGGYAYPRVGVTGGGLYNDVINTIPDFRLWFSILGLFQSIGMWSISRKAWLMFVTGGIASALTVLSLVYLQIYYFDPFEALLLGTFIQSVGTGLIALYLMANPREGSVPKREKAQGMKFQPHNGLSTRGFISLWIGIYYFAQLLIAVLLEIWYRMLAYKSIELYWINLPQTYVIIFSMTGVATAIAQHWLIQSRHSIRYWHLFTVVGWIFAGFAAGQHFNYEADYSRLQENFFLGVSLALPLLFQTIPMKRAMRGGWLWAVVGIASFVLIVLFQNWAWFSRSRLLYGTIFGGLFMSVATACLFLWLVARNKETIETA